jgi:tRNA(adenine34) deaminase
MQHALGLAERAAQAGEVPVGAVVVRDGDCLGEGWNQPLATSDPSGHAEIIALRKAGKYISNYRILNSTLYVTLEPCIMCAGVLVHARVARVVFGASDPKSGALGTVWNVPALPDLNHHYAVQGGLLAEPSARLLQAFFRARRGG